MSVMTTMIWTPNSSGAVAQLGVNLNLFRDAARSAGYTCDTMALIPGGGGVQGEMGIAMEYADSASYAASLDAEPAPEILAAQAATEYSDSAPSRTSTWMELPGLETPYDELPKGMNQVSYIRVHPGKQAQAMETVAKSKEIMNRLGCKVRVMNGFLGSPAGILMFAMFHESATAWGSFNEKLMADEEWLAHWNDPARVGVSEIVRQSAFTILP